MILDFKLSKIDCYSKITHTKDKKKYIFNRTKKHPLALLFLDKLVFSLKNT